MTQTQVPSLNDPSAIRSAVDQALADQPILDLHTHLYPPSFGTPTPGAGGLADPNGLMLWGIDDLLTYHYLIAELFRVVKVDADPFFAMAKTQQADLIWNELFLNRAPISESCRGVLTTLNRLGLDTAERDLTGYRAWFAAQDPDAHVDRVMALAGVNTITMTNDPFDPNERARWSGDAAALHDARFEPVLRIDPLVVDWAVAASELTIMGYDIGAPTDPTTVESVKTFLRDWIARMEPRYLAASLPPSFMYPADTVGAHMLAEAILPICREHGLSFAMMIGVERGVNPALRQAGDMGFKSDIHAVTNLCSAFADNKFMLTMLSRENQHELAVAARKFGNLMVFGCWWFLNNPSLIEEMTRFRMELLGLSFVPQHSDCRVLEQLLYKWDHSKAILAKVLTDKLVDLAATGWRVTDAEIRRDVDRLLRKNYLDFIAR